MKKMVPLFMIACSFFLLSGCYDRKPLESQSYVMAIGIDNADEENMYNITYQIANPEVGTSISGGGSDEPSSETVTLRGNDLISATNTANAFVSKELGLDHAKVIVVSEELARSNRFLEIIQAATRTNEIRSNVQILVSKESASDFLNNNQPELEKRPHKNFEITLNRASETGIVPKSTVHRFFQITEGDADLFLAVYATTEKEETKKGGHEDEYMAGEVFQEGGSPTQYMGSAVFKEGKMIDTITGAETRIALTLDNTIDLADLDSTFVDPLNPEYRIAGTFSKKRATEVNIKYSKTKPTIIDVHVPFEIEIYSLPSLEDYANNKKKQDLLKREIETTYEKEAMKLLKKSQEEYRSDLSYWSLYVRKYFKTIEEYEQADWNNSIFPNAEINVTYDLNRLGFGKVISEMKLDEVRD